MDEDDDEDDPFTQELLRNTNFNKAKKRRETLRFKKNKPVEFNDLDLLSPKS